MCIGFKYNKYIKLLIFYTKRITTSNKNYNNANQNEFYLGCAGVGQNYSTLTENLGIHALSTWQGLNRQISMRRKRVARISY